MKYFDSNTRLTDSLERELIARAVQEQMDFRPGKALKAFFTELFSKSESKASHTNTDNVQTAS